jgi:hypothetical protein
MIQRAPFLRHFPLASGLLASLIFCMMSCGTAIPDPQEADLRMLPGDLSGISLNDLRNGRKLYVQNCGGCHRLKPPQEQTDSQWIESYAKMRTRVELNRSEEERLLAYLRAFAKRPYPSDSTR